MIAATPAVLDRVPAGDREFPAGPLAPVAGPGSYHARRAARASPAHQPRLGRAMTTADANVTQLLRAASSGDRRDLDALMHAIYADLRRLAAGHMKAERGDHTLQPTALANEAYLRLIDQRSVDWKDRLQFFAVASLVIRRILVDHARERRAAKRGGGARRVPLDDGAALVGMPDADAMDLDQALKELAEIDPQQARVVELRYFAGLTIEEIAEVLGIGKRSVDREWQVAKAWLFRRLSDRRGDATDA